MIPGISAGGGITGGNDDFGSDTFSSRFGDFNVNSQPGINWSMVIIAVSVVAGYVVLSRGK